MAITGELTAAAGHTDDAEWRLRGQRPSGNASFRLIKDDLVTRNGRLSGNGKPPRVSIVDDLSSEAGPVNAEGAHAVDALASDALEQASTRASFIARLELNTVNRRAKDVQRR